VNVKQGKETCLVVATIPAGESYITSATLEVGVEKKVLGKVGVGEK
jgi:hypothetical protein